MVDYFSYVFSDPLFWVIIYFFLVFIVGIYGDMRKLGMLKTIAISIMLSPLIGFIVAYLIGKEMVPVEEYNIKAEEAIKRKDLNMARYYLTYNLKNYPDNSKTRDLANQINMR